MYVRVTQLSFDAAKKQEMERFGEERIIPQTRHLTGFGRYTVALDEGGGRGITLTEWNDLQQAQKYRTAVASLLREVRDLGITLQASQAYGSWSKHRGVPLGRERP